MDDFELVEFSKVFNQNIKNENNVCKEIIDEISIWYVDVRSGWKIIDVF